MEDKFIVVDQAYYGEVGRSHDCISSTNTEAFLKAELIAFTDKPSNTNGAALSTYYSAAVISPYFVFAKTIPDPNASRSGMVFTHVLLLPVHRIGEIESLSEIFELFVNDVPINKQLPLTPINFQVKTQRGAELTIYPKYVTQVVQNLIKGIKIEYFGDVEHFIKIIIVVWKGLPPLLRRHLTFSIGFSSSDVERKAVTALYFKPELSARVNSNNSIFQNDDEKLTVTDSVELFILGIKENNAFADFLESFNILLTDFNTLTIADKAFQLFKGVSTASPDELRQLVRLVAKLSPSAKDGSTAKGQILSQISTTISTGLDYNVKALRNIDLQAFAGSDFQLGKVLEAFIAAQFNDKLKFIPTNIYELAEICRREQFSTWWFTSVEKALTVAFSEVQSFKNIWRLLGLPGLNPDCVFSFLEKSLFVEDNLIANLPEKLLKENSVIIKPYFQKLKWFRLYAYSSLFYLKAIAAMNEQLKVEAGLNLEKSRGVKIIAEQITDIDLMEMSLVSNDNRLLQLFNSRLAVDDALLSKLDTSKPNWLVIWSEHIKITNKIWEGIVNIKDKANELIQLVAQKINVPNNLIDELSLTEFADITSVKNREAFWQHVPVIYKSRFLSATANGYVDMLASGHEFIDLPEQVLVAYCCSDNFISVYLSKYRLNMEAVLSFFSHFLVLKDDYLAGYINYFSGNIGDLTSAKLGTFIQANNFQVAAQSVFEKAKVNDSFRIALTQCRLLVKLNIWDKIFHAGLFGITLDENAIYEALYEISKELYKRGPDENDIWKRAGGEISKFKNDATREEQWRHAISLLRNGGAGKDVSVKSMLKEMQHDHHHSNELKELYKYFK